MTKLKTLKVEERFMSSENTLRTLKDLKQQDFGDGWNGFIDKEELKAEAVKWFKDFKIGHNIREDKIINIEEFIKHFFNLTEEDLEEKEE